VKITIHRYGGLAGTNEVLAIVDTQQLRGEKTKTVRDALDRLTQLALKHHPAGADFVRYELLVEDAGKTSTVSFSDDGSETAVQLTKLVNAIAEAGKKKSQ
jgi:hypothetical protein